MGQKKDLTSKENGRRKEKRQTHTKVKKKKSDAKPVTKYLPQADKCSASPQAMATYPKHTQNLILLNFIFAEHDVI